MTLRSLVLTVLAATLVPLATSQFILEARQAFRAQTSTEIDCQGICTTVPPEEQQICMQACLEALGGSSNSGTETSQQGGAGSSSGGGPTGGEESNSFTEPFTPPPAQPPAESSPQEQEFSPINWMAPVFPTTVGPAPSGARPAAPSTPAPSATVPSAPASPSTQAPPTPPATPPSASTQECTATSFRQRETQFCLLADRCMQNRLAKRGFAIDPSCQGSVDFTRTYRTAAFKGGGESLHGSAPNPSDDFIAVLNRAIFAIDQLIPIVPAGAMAQASVKDLRTYLLTVLGNLATHKLTMLEREATAQYLRLRLLETIGLLRAAGINPGGEPPAHGAAPAPEKPYIAP